MPDIPIKPPNKLVAEFTTDVTTRMHDTFSPGELKDIRHRKEIDFLVKEIATLKAELHELRKNK